METWQTLGVQLGISGLVVVAAYRVAILLINTWSANDKVRTAAMVKSDSERTTAIKDGFKSVTDVHALLSAKQDKLHNLVLRIDQKVSTALDLTPVGTTIPPGIREAIETPSRPLEPEPTVIVKDESARKTPPGGVRVPPRHRTSG